MEMSSSWPEMHPSLGCSFSSDDSMESMIYSTNPSFTDRRFSTASNDSWDAPQLSAGASSILTPASHPSTPTHDDSGRNPFFLRMHGSQMYTLGTPEGKPSSSFFLDSSPMPHQDSPLRHRFPVDGLSMFDMPRMTPSPARQQTYVSTPSSMQQLPHGLRMPPSPNSSFDTGYFHPPMVKQTRSNPLMSSFTMMSVQQSSPIHNDTECLRVKTDFKPEQGRSVSPWATSCITVVPSSITKPDTTLFQSSPLSGSTDDAFNPPEDVMTGFESCDDMFLDSPESDSGTEWSSRPMKSTRKLMKTSGVRTGGIRKKNLKQVPLPGTNDSITAVHIPAKIHKCTQPGCTRRFSRAEHLKRHMKTHEKNHKPHRCALPDHICSKWFGRTDNRTQHYFTHLKPKDGRAERNKAVDSEYLYQCIRDMDPENADKLIPKLQQKVRKFDAGREKNVSKLRFFHVNSS